jgi:hypothetical protein
MTSRIDFTILGELASKANSRKAALINGPNGKRAAFIKSPKALLFVRSAGFQIPTYAQQRLDGTVKVTGIVYYETWQPDLDEALLLDVLQDQWEKVGTGTAARKYLSRPGVYINDRQVVEKHFVRGYWQPGDVARAEIRVEEVEHRRLVLPDFPTLEEQREREAQYLRDKIARQTGRAAA